MEALERSHLDLTRALSSLLSDIARGAAWNADPGHMTTYRIIEASPQFREAEATLKRALDVLQRSLAQ